MLAQIFSASIFTLALVTFGILSKKIKCQSQYLETLVKGISNETHRSNSKIISKYIYCESSELFIGKYKNWIISKNLVSKRKYKLKKLETYE